MKRAKANLLLVVLSGTFLVAGCHTTSRQAVMVTPTGEVLAPTKPPPTRHEVLSTRPSASYAWMDGYWTYQNSRWNWIPGHWEAPISAGATWVPGHWNPSTRGWIWTPGHSQ